MWTYYYRLFNLTNFPRTQLFFLGSAFYVIFLMRTRYLATYDSVNDSINTLYIIAPSAFLSLFTTRAIWMGLSWGSVILDVRPSLCGFNTHLPPIVRSEILCTRSWLTLYCLLGVMGLFYLRGSCRSHSANLLVNCLTRMSQFDLALCSDTWCLSSVLCFELGLAIHDRKPLSTVVCHAVRADSDGYLFGLLVLLCNCNNAGKTFSSSWCLWWLKRQRKESEKKGKRCGDVMWLIVKRNHHCHAICQRAIQPLHISLDKRAATIIEHLTNTNNLLGSSLAQTTNSRASSSSGWGTTEEMHS